ncbi:MAG: calcium-binding protein, partial [Rickettsiales bacterium]|nr:calcium-binding protein [Rickettsiales bacterium]
MSITVTELGKRNVDGVAGDEYVWKIVNGFASDVTYTWTAVGGETGSITLIAGAETLLYTNTLDDITLTDGGTTVATGTYVDQVLGTYSAGNAANVIYGHEGNDRISGQGGSDYISTGVGNDVIYGGSGDDTIIGGLGRDYMRGDAGTDLFIIGVEANQYDVINSFAPATTTDKVDLTAFSDLYFDSHVTQVGAHVYVELGNGQQLRFYNLNRDDFTVDHFIGMNAGADPNGGPTVFDDVLTGTGVADVIDALAGDDLVNASSGNDSILGGDGEDTLNGGNENDTLRGGDDNDTLNGDSGNDSLYGGNQNDTINGGAGDDRLYGDNNNDVLDGGAGNDIIYGGNGDDTIIGGLGRDYMRGDAGTDLFIIGVEANQYDVI